MCNHGPVSDGGKPDFDRPPVQTTVLTVFFEPITMFDLSFVLPLQQRWGERYPDLSQVGLRGRPPRLPDAEIEGVGGWPFPGTQQTSRELGRTLSYQADQLSLTWQLDKETPDATYPGYPELFKEFRNRFSEFVDRVESMAKPIKVQGARCVYENYLSEIAGVDYIAQFIAGFPDDEAVAANRLADSSYVGFRLNKEPSKTKEGSEVFASAQIDAPRDRTTTLDVDVTTRPLPSSPLDDGRAVDVTVHLMNDAHDALVNTFLECTSSRMQENWGRRR